MPDPKRRALVFSLKGSTKTYPADHQKYDFGPINGRFAHTGSFRKNGKSKTVFMSTKFHKKLIFSAFLATNLRSWASRTAKITLWYPEKLAPPVCFQALVGCLKPTTDPETFSKDHKGVFWFVWGKNGSTKEYECVHTADFATYKSKHNEWLAL